MQHAKPPLHLYARDAVEDALSNAAPAIPFSTDDDTRQAAAAMVEFLAIHIREILRPEAERRLVLKVLAHLSSTGLQTKGQIFQFAMTRTDELSRRLHAQPSLISSDASLEDILR